VDQQFSQLEVESLDDVKAAEYLGTGSFGETWRIQTAGGLEVARKFLHEAGYEVDRLNREVEGLRRVSSPYVVTLLGVGESAIRGENLPHLDFEFIPGGDLQQWGANGGALADEDAVALAEGLLQGAAALHQAQVLHRDIKPANIGLRNSDPRHPVLLDLGLAKLLDIESITRYPSLIGTAMYASPEQLRGERAVKASDVWSIGVVMHEAVCRRHPFYTVGERLMLTELLQRLPTPPPLPPESPKAVQALINRCLQPEPYQRGNAGPAYRRLRREVGEA
jgi:serine/threonine protein kinase